jgi:hypothetical protein
MNVKMPSLFWECEDKFYRGTEEWGFKFTLKYN